MADRIVLSSDSDDEYLEEMLARTRRKRVIRERTDNEIKWSDEEFLMRFRLTKETVRQLLDQIHEQLETTTDRNDALSPMNQLLLTLRYYATGNVLISIGDFSGVHKSTASRIVHKVTVAIAGLRNLYVKFPTTEEQKSYKHEGFYRMAAFPRVVGAIDCTHVKIQSPGGENAEDFRNRKGFFSINVQTISDHKLRILDIVARWPGSAHDQTIFNNSAIKARFERGEMGNSILVADSGYTSTRYMMTPLRNPILPEENLYNESQIRTRNAVERQYGVWKRRFPVLALGMRVRVDRVQAIIVACAVLHNLAIEMGEDEPPANPHDREEVDAAINNGEIPHLLADQERNVPTRDGLVQYFRTLL